jgi:hypothetical protein
MAPSLLLALLVAAPARPLHLVAGINGAPLVNHLGAQVGVGYSIWAWSAGEFVLGAQLAAHFYLPNPGLKDQPGVLYSTRSVDLRPSLVLGHEFFVAQHLELGVHLFFGPNFRFIDASLKDSQNDFQAQYHHLATTFELGAMMTVGWRFTDALCVEAMLAVPLAATGSSSVMQAWLVAPPYLGAAVRLSF